MSDSTEQLLQQAFVHFSAKRFAQAEGGYRKVLDREPDNHEAIHMSAVIAHTTGQTDRAAKLFARAIELAPNLAHYHHNAGKFFAEFDKHHSAIPYFERAIELSPTDPTMRSNLSNSLRYVARLDDAEDVARAGLAIDPNHAGCLSQLGNALRETGRVPEGIEAMTKSVAIRPISSIHDNLIFLLYNDPSVTAQRFLEHHRLFAQLYTDPLAARATPPKGVDRNPDRKLRVGYVSADFRNHPVMKFMDAPLRHHDAKQFDVTCYAMNLQEDDVTRQVKKYPLRFVGARFDDYDQFVSRVRKDHIDILVDLSGHTAHNRLICFAGRPAPVQISYLGDPGSTGLAQMDYRVTDPVVDPPGQGQQWYTESLLRLPGGFSCYTPDAKAHPDVTPLPALANGYITFGSLHALAKINEQVIDLWARVLRAVPDSRLLMLRHTLNGRTLDRYRDAFTSRGVDASRLQLCNAPVGGPTHLFTYRHIDCCLDCFPFSGHTTTCEAMFNGVPTITLPTEPPHSRFVASVLTMAGLTDFIASGPDHFVSIATNLAADLPRLATLRAGLRQEMLASALCDGATFTRQLESAYRDAWRRYCAEVGDQK